MFFTDRKKARRLQDLKQSFWFEKCPSLGSQLLCWFLQSLFYLILLVMLQLPTVNMNILTEYIGINWFSLDVGLRIHVASWTTFYLMKLYMLFYKYRRKLWVISTLKTYRKYVQNTWNFWIILLLCILHKELIILDCRFSFLLPSKFSCIVLISLC